MINMKKRAWNCKHIDKPNYSLGRCVRCGSKNYRDRLKKKLGVSGYKAWCFVQSLLSRYHLAIDRYNEMLKKQENKCICGRMFGLKRRDRPQIDHDHACCDRIGFSCGKCIRGLLCFRCNATLGFFEKESHLLPDHLKLYLKRYADERGNS